ncbi:hypothetical protein GCM10027614_13900 [Micromonospora vulcania]
MWNSLPGSSVTVCIRPLGSVSCTRSPGRNGPRCTGVSAGVAASAGTVEELRSRCHLPVGFEELRKVRDVQDADDIFA